LEDWKPQEGEVLRLCEAIRAGEVVEETWKLAGLVLEETLLHWPRQAVWQWIRLAAGVAEAAGAAL